MRIEDLIRLLNNRLKEFKLSRDYAKMSGDLERMNAADEEIISLEDTLYKLNLLVDTTKSAAVKGDILAEVITNGSVAVLGEYDITPYATDPEHEEKVMNILSKMGVMDTAEKIDDYIKGKYLSSPVTGEMIVNAAQSYEVDARLMMAIMEQDSRFGTIGIATSTLNPGNVGNDDSGNTRTYESWQEGVTAVAEWLSRHRGSEIISEIPDMATSTPPMATSTPLIITPTATSTPITASSGIPPEAVATATTTPVITTSTTTTTTTTSTPITATTTPANDTSQPEAGPPLAETPETIPVITSTTTTATTTPVTATSTPTTSTTMPITESVPEPEPEPTPEPEPEPTPEPEPEPTPEPEPKPEPEPQPEVDEPPAQTPEDTP